MQNMVDYSCKYLHKLFNWNNFIEENVAYKDNIKINITGGTLTTTKNNPIIVELNPTIGTEKELCSEVTGMYSVKKTTENSAVFYYTAK